MVKAYVAVGSNIDPEENVKKAVRLLAHHTRIFRISTVYMTEPEGRPEQPPFYNLIVEVETEISPEELKYRVLRVIENELGRIRTRDKYAPRTIDLDLVLYDGLVLQVENLILPDPEILRRPFLAFPLSELSPDLALPGTGLAIQQVLSQLSRETMKPLYRFTELLRKEIFNGSKS